jgi:hypothetical protein
MGILIGLSTIIGLKGKHLILSEVILFFNRLRLVGFIELVVRSQEFYISNSLGMGSKTATVNKIRLFSKRLLL